ncbi:FeoA family protein [Bdellovibrionota bacterium FG-1]
MSGNIKLGELKRGFHAQIVSVGSAWELGTREDNEMIARLMEMGLIEGSSIEVVHEAPFSGDPIAVRVRGALIALRRNEANHVWVKRVSAV